MDKNLIDRIFRNTLEQARQWVERYKAAGARQIKLYSSLKPDVVKAITAEAHGLGMTVTGHIPEGMTAIEGVNDGMDQINHIEYVLPYFCQPVLGPDGKPDTTKPPVLDRGYMIWCQRSKRTIPSLIQHSPFLKQS